MNEETSHFQNIAGWPRYRLNTVFFVFNNSTITVSWHESNLPPSQDYHFIRLILNFRLKRLIIKVVYISPLLYMWSNTKISFTLERSASPVSYHVSARSLYLFTLVTRNIDIGFFGVWLCRYVVFLNIQKLTSRCTGESQSLKPLDSPNQNSYPWIYFIAISSPISRTPDYSNQCSFPLGVRQIVIPLYIFAWVRVKCRMGERWGYLGQLCWL